MCSRMEPLDSSAARAAGAWRKCAFLINVNPCGCLPVARRAPTGDDLLVERVEAQIVGVIQFEQLFRVVLGLLHAMRPALVISSELARELLPSGDQRRRLMREVGEARGRRPARRRSISSRHGLEERECTSPNGRYRAGAGGSTYAHSTRKVESVVHANESNRQALITGQQRISLTMASPC